MKMDAGRHDAPMAMASSSADGSSPATSRFPLSFPVTSPAVSPVGEAPLLSMSNTASFLEAARGALSSAA